ncbi:helix-turn-helix domain-containing protein [Streptomyces sp. NBC_01613]|uniref:helix-turn-helix domain-containing protein n=1 Tax=Streptomyces sp. NBC_01613 TaxID=2975896 RepID=UPI003863D8DE
MLIPAVGRWYAVRAGWWTDGEGAAVRERIRYKAGERFARGERTAVIAKDLRVSERSVERWRRAWREGEWTPWPPPGRRNCPSCPMASSPSWRRSWLSDRPSMAGRTSGGPWRGSER